MTGRIMKTSKRFLPRLAAAALCLVMAISSSAAEQTAEDLLGVFTVNHGPRDSKKIAITMDDVYETEWVWKSVELCKQYGIAMTYFPIGINVREEDGENWRALLDAGCEIGSHSMNHLNFRDIGEYTAIERLGRFQERLDKVLGFHYEVRWFRPPTGSITDKKGSTAAMVRAIFSSVFPPLAISGMSGNFSRIFATTSGVFVPQATFRISAPAFSLALISVFSWVTVIITGISTAAATAARFRLLIGAFRITPMAPWHSTSLARATVRSPFVVPPPTPQKTGI